MNIELNGNTYLMKPNFQALSEIELAIGKSLLTLAKEFDVKGILLHEQTKIIYHAVKAGGNILSEEEIGKIICQQGMSKSAKLILKFLRNIIGEDKC